MQNAASLSRRRFIFVDRILKIIGNKGATLSRLTSFAASH